ncbi:hypothetical protein [Streptomyces phaeofaciens]|uniref:hypothetical protein n=1 Tax=Streptomyces phaeofaciens TaxID=68254 RepID=UPI0036A51F47
MRLDWPDFQLEVRPDGHLRFEWRRYGRVGSHVSFCDQLRLLPQGADGLSQWVFHLRYPAGPTPGLLVVRVDVPAERLPEAEEYTERLRRHFRIPEHRDDAAEEAPIQRVPLEAPQWIAAPAGAASEELFAAVMARVDGDPG